MLKILKAKTAVLMRRRNHLFDLLTRPSLRGIRRAAYGLIPSARLLVAHYICRNGDIALARRELNGPHTADAARMAERLDAMLAVVAGTPVKVGQTDRQRPAGIPDTIRKNGPVLMALSSSLPYHKAGYARRTDALIRTLRAQGIAVHAVTRPNYPQDRPPQAPGPTTRELDGAGLDNVVYHRLSAPEVTINRSPDEAYISAYADALIRVAQDTGATVLHAHSNFLNGLAAAEAGRRLALPVIYEVRGLWYLTQAAEDQSFADSEFAHYQRTMEQAAMAACDAVVTIADCLRDELIRQGVPAGKIRVMPNAVDPALFTPAPRDEALAQDLGMTGRTVVGFAGSLNGYEGVDRLIDAVMALVAEGLDLGLVIAGTGPAASALKARARRTGGRVVLIGAVDFAQMRRLYSLFDICPLPRLDLAVCRIVPPMKSLEIMAMAKPLVVSALPPLLEFGEEGISRLSCPPGDTATLAAVLRDLVCNGEKRNRIGRAARNWALEHRTWQAVGHRYAALYRELNSKP